jgi:acyl-CoA reductase-like NAD-dependent aldehyde dehydrogenase
MRHAASSVTEEEISMTGASTAEQANGDGGVARTVRSYAPATGELLAELPVAPPAEVAAVVARAKKAQAAWAVLTIEERASRLLRFRDALLERVDEMVDLIALETGKPRQEALLHEVFVALDLMTYYAAEAPRALAEQTIDFHLFRHRRGTVRYAPAGVVGVISPWNFPLVIPIGTVVAALVAGNAVVVKPSEVTPLVMLKAKEIYDATGMPEDLFSVVVGYGETGAALIDGGIQRMVFTGAVATGKKVGAACGARLIPCVLELGGKAPLIARADADIEKTARAIAYGGLANAGQACVSVERIYAHEKIHDALVARTVAIVRTLRPGDPLRADVDVGPMIFAPQLAIVERHVRDAIAKGATVEVGGERRVGPGDFFEPTVLSRCNGAMSVMNEEIFGPIAPFQKVASDDEAIALANASHLGLNAYVFSKDATRAKSVAERIEAGSVVVNDVLSNYAAVEAPFGGIKQSGYGRVHGANALRDLCDVRHVNLERFALPVADAGGFPYTDGGYRFARRAMRALFTRGGVARKIASLF